MTRTLTLTRLPCSIWELCMIQQQRFGGSILGTPARFVKEYGTAALTRGVTMTIGREAMFTMSMLGITYASQRSNPGRTPSIPDQTAGLARTPGAEQLCCYSAQRVNPASDRPLIQQRLVESSGVEKNTALAIGALSGAILAGTTTHP